MYVANPSASAFLANVPITSSASPPRLAQDRDIKRLAEPEYVRQCLAQILGHCLALGFVLFVLVVPVRRLRRVENDGDMRRLALFDNGRARYWQRQKRPTYSCPLRSYADCESSRSGPDRRGPYHRAGRELFRSCRILSSPSNGLVSCFVVLVDAGHVAHPVPHAPEERAALLWKRGDHFGGTGSPCPTWN